MTPTRSRWNTCFDKVRSTKTRRYATDPSRRASAVALQRVADKAGISPEMAKIGSATVLPMVMAQFTQGGQQAPPSSGYGGMAGQILGRFL